MRDFGVVRKDISGDPEAAAPYIGAARALLGQVKERMAAGGLQQLARTVQLPDGTMIRAESRMGQDTIRILATVPQSAPTQALPFFQTPEPPPDEPPHPTSEEPPELPIPQSHPYMWIGVRYRWEDYPNPTLTSQTMPLPSLLFVVVEPGNNGVIMADNPVVWAGYTNYPGINPGDTGTVDLNAMQASFVANYASEFVPTGVHNFAINGTAGGGSVFFCSRNGLRLYSEESTYEDTLYTPYDPLGAPNPPRYIPSVFQRYSGGNYVPWGAKNKWDQVAVLDPWEDQAIKPFDPRAETQWARQMLKRSGVKTDLSGVLDGNYEILIGAYGESNYVSDRPGQQSPFLPTGVGWRYNQNDFREHLKLSTVPLKVDVEVRLGKLPTMTTHKFTIEVDDYDDWYLTTQPYGGGTGPGCAYTFGSNPMAKNWYQGAILVNPKSGSVSLKPGYQSRVFNPRPYSLDTLRRTRYPVDFYYMTLGSGNTTTAGNMLYQVMDMQCCGYFAQMLEMVTRSAADVTSAAVLAGITTNRVYKYDNIKNTFTDVGFYDGTSGFRTMADPLAAASLAICHFPIFCGSDSSISPDYWGTAPGGAGCCADVLWGS